MEKSKNAKKMREDLPAVDDRDDLVPPPHCPHQTQVLDGPLHGLSEEGGQEGFMLKTDEGERVKTPCNKYNVDDGY